MPETQADLRGSKLSDVLVRIGIVNQEQVDAALKRCDPEERQLEHILVEMGCCTEEKILKAVGIRLGIPYFTTFEGIGNSGAARLVPEMLARKYLIVPVFKSDDVMTIGMSNPMDIDAIDAVARHTGLRIRCVMTTLANVFEAIQRAYGRSQESMTVEPIPRALDQAGPQAQEMPLEMLGAPQPALKIEPNAPDPTSQSVVERFQREPPAPVKRPEEDQSAVELANLILQEGMSRRASDIHIEIAEKMVRVRFRVDGILQDGRTLEKDMASSFIARIKILAKLDITETRLPQDGHLRFNYAGRGVDIRVSVLPTIHGEKIVMRILDSSKGIKKLTELGFSETNLKAFSLAIKRPNGMVLVTGPTGSGKTTTLYAAVAHLNDETRNIITLEDPVEYRIDRVNQVEMLPKIGLTFAAGLRSVLRQDPNVILVGEIRDLETAEIAIQAAITGHLVFSTLHTNDAVATIHRLLNMKVEPFLISAALGGVLAQRLVRSLCDRCRRPHQLTQAELEALGQELKVSATFFEPVGCKSCLDTGYKGRIAIHEWLNVSRGIRDMILTRASLDDMRAQAKSEGMVSLQQDAMSKAVAGLTSLAEVVRVTREDQEA